MSPDPRKPTKAERQSDARARSRAMREQRERAEKRRRAALVTIAGLVAAAVVAVVVVAIASGGEDDAPQAVPASFSESGGYTTGDADAPVSVSIYQDYQCPFCAQFEAANSDFIEQAREAGDISVTYYPLDLLRRLGDYSARAASAAVCVAEEAPEQFGAFNDALYENQPQEGAGGLTDRQIAAVASDAGVPDDVDACITSGRYTDWVSQVTDDRDERVQGTPTVLVDDQVLPNPDQFQAAVEQALAGGGATGGATDGATAGTATS
ncbi:thioredoxin domain-containing protein [uncultured Pseudokineococcus sp.]|uniref:DsbA family protein n=1 Tax=uncultured Pseudokineococcus sp. TaxID=1642928 RepID=UPI002624D035|nr:thioredoxin domain-containing protein [uncultured Pseudokineococcus sp.]